MDNILSIKDKFGRYTGLRHMNVSEKSGEEFYHTILNSEFKNSVEKKVRLTIDLDGVRGYSPSFIDEAFGNLVYDFSLGLVEEFLHIKSDDKPFWIELIKNETFPQWEKRRLSNELPKITSNHPPHWRYLNNEFVKSK